MSDWRFLGYGNSYPRGNFGQDDPRLQPPVVTIIDDQDPKIDMRPDMVNHPPHYTNHPSGVECITITRHMGFNLGNAVKYIWRADLKSNALEDLKKARFYINDEIERIECANSSS